MTVRRVSLPVAGSVLAHGLALVGLVVIVAPDPPPDQTRPTSRLTIASQHVRQTTATVAENAGQPAAESTAPLTAARQGIARQTTTPQVPVSGESVAPIPPPDEAAATLAVTGPVTQAIIAATSIAPTPPAAAAVTVVLATPPAVSVASNLGHTTPVIVALTAPTTQVTTPLAQPLEVLAASPPPAVTAAMVVPAPATAQQRELPVNAQTAALAWSGDGSTPISAESLVAITAFSELGDPNAAAQQVRDGIAGILASVPCARLQTIFNPDTGNLELTGHIPQDGLRNPVLTALQAQVGDAIPVTDNLLILPRPQCNALSGIAAIDLPQSTEQLTNPRVIGIDGFAQNYTYSDGQALELDLIGPDYDSFVYVDYFVADGTVIHLQPNTTVPLEPLPAKAPMSVGRDIGPKPFLQLTVSPPFGQEIAAAIATSVPLYDGLRPVQEPAEAYIAFLKAQVATARARDPNFKGEWVYFFITTQPE